MKKPSQKDIVAAKLKLDGEISNVWAFEHFILRLSNKIRLLKAEGWQIDGSYIEGTKNWSYRLISAPRKPSMYVRNPLTGEHITTEEYSKL